MKAILVHGGAWATPEGEIDSQREGVERAARSGFDVLRNGGPALDAAIAAVRLMEDDPAFNAGYGAVLNQLGEVELDAALMDGTSLSAGAVAAVKGVANPIDLARRVMDRSPHVLLTGVGALEFAREQNVTLCTPESLIVDRERRRWHDATESKKPVMHESALISGPSDTVGAVARDESGRLAAAASTGGTLGKLAGRVGDTPLIGCGLYADNRLGAAASTGWGEGIIRVVMAQRAVDLLASGSPAREAARQAIALLEERTGGRGGIIIISPDGTLGFAFNTPHMAHAYLTDGMEGPVVGV
ncbi:MAG: isoaspartyl peptidase/L-asparaginase [Vicinamibacteria bacterium]